MAKPCAMYTTAFSLVDRLLSASNFQSTSAPVLSGV
jgi:hypothetical protein